jgi:hypothetical protein
MSNEATDTAVLEDKDVLTLPTDPETLNDFITSEVMPLVHAEKRGAKTLLKSLRQYQTISAYAAKHLERAQRNLNTVNGVRTPLQHTGYKVRSLHGTAKKFYTMVADTDDASYTAIRQHCKVFNIDFDSYADIDSVIAALVNQHVAAQNND